MKKIPIMDLQLQYRSVKSDIQRMSKNIFERQAFILGPDVKQCEESISKYCSAEYGVGLNSGTDALILALDAMGIGAGDEVITTPFTFIATAEAICRVGAIPVFVDIDPVTYNIDPGLIAKSITKKTKAIIPVHLYGLCADMDPIMKVASKYGLKVIEDAAQAIGSLYKNRKAGSLAHAAAISFYPGKNLGCFGDGGMIVTSDKKLSDKIRVLRDHGSSVRYYHEAVGYNSRLDNFQAAVLNIKLKHLDGWIEGRIKNAMFYNDSLKELPIAVPCIPSGYKHSFHQYTLRSSRKKEIEEYLIKNGIEVRTYYPVPLHLQKCFANLGYKAGAFPEAEKASAEVFSIPVYPELTDRQKKYIAEKIRSFFTG